MKCSKTIYTGERWDFTGHPCSRTATVERDGTQYCTQHDPQREVARRETRQQQWNAEEAAQRDTKESASALAARLGAGIPYFHMHRGYTGGVVLTAEEAQILANRMEANHEA